MPLNDCGCIIWIFVRSQEDHPAFCLALANKGNFGLEQLQCVWSIIVTYTKHRLCAVNGNSFRDGNAGPELKQSKLMGGKEQIKEEFALWLLFPLLLYSNLEECLTHDEVQHVGMGSPPLPKYVSTAASNDLARFSEVQGKAGTLNMHGPSLEEKTSSSISLGWPGVCWKHIWRGWELFDKGQHLVSLCLFHYAAI